MTPPTGFFREQRRFGYYCVHPSAHVSQTAMICPETVHPVRTRFVDGDDLLPPQSAFPIFTLAKPLPIALHTEQFVPSGHGPNAQDRQPLGPWLRGARRLHLSRERSPFHRFRRVRRTHDKDSAQHGLPSNGEPAAFFHAEGNCSGAYELYLWMQMMNCCFLCLKRGQGLSLGAV